MRTVGTTTYDAGADISMELKMGAKCFPQIHDLAAGRPLVGDADFLALCDFVDARLDCADFRLISILRAMYAWPDRLGSPAAERARRTILGFKYWMDEPGADSMCYWSENHQILFATCEYLAGQLYPDQAFANDGRSGAAKRDRAATRIHRWLEHRFVYGFTEWHSNVYYEEDIAPLTLLVDFAADRAIVERSKMVLDLLLLDMAMHSWKGLFVATSGRCYEDQKCHPLTQDTLEIGESLWGFGHVAAWDWTRISAHFHLCRGYDVPELIRAVGRDPGPVEIRDSMGLDLAEVRDEFADPDDIDTTGMFLWSMEAFTNPESIAMTMKIFKAWNLGSNTFLRNLSALDLPLLRSLGVYPWISRALNPSTNGVAIQRSNSYTFKTPHYMLSTSQGYHPGEFGDQQHIWQATLAPDVTVFTTHPAAPLFADNARNFSPSHWVGNGVLPHSAQHRNVHMSIYRLGGRRGYLERERLAFTHAWFPTDRFDEVVLDGVHAFGRVGRAHVGLVGSQPLRRSGDAPNELLLDGTEQAWVCVVDSADNGDFASFQHALRSTPMRFSGDTLRFGRHTLVHGEGLRIDDRPVRTDYARIESPYGHVPRKARVMSFAHGDTTLRLDFDTLERRHGGGEPGPGR